MKHPFRNLFYRLVEEKVFILVYGPYATGKTHLAYEVYNIALELGYNPVIIATEPGTKAFLRGVEAVRTTVLTMDELVEATTRIVLEGRYPVIDSINWFYRERPGPEYGRLLAYISALLRGKGGFATAQVSGVEEEASGSPYILPWSHAHGRTLREKGLYLLEFETPVKKVLGFRIRGKRVEWV